MVHNGIIENYKELKEYLQKKGFVFLSETDTEVVAHLLDYYYKGNPLEAIAGPWAVSAVPMRWVSFSKTSREKFMRCGKTAR